MHGKDHIAQTLGHAKRWAQRLEINLLSEEGKTPSEISRQLGVSRPTVYLWQRRYDELGLAGLQRDLPRSGRKSTFTREQESIVVKEVLRSKQGEGPSVSIQSLGRLAGLSYGVTRRILLKHGLKSFRMKGEFRDKVEQTNWKDSYEQLMKRTSLPSFEKETPAPKNNVLKKEPLQSHGRVTQKWIAGQCGLSQATVSLALKGDLRLKTETRLKVQKTAQRNHYLPNPNSSGLINLRWKGRARYVNFVLFAGEASSHAQREFHALIKREAIALGYGLEIMELNDDLRMETLNNHLYQRGIQGVILGRGIPSRLCSKLKAGLDWPRFSAFSLGLSIGWLNSIEGPDSHKMLHHCFNELQALNYKRIGYFSVPRLTSPLAAMMAPVRYNIAKLFVFRQARSYSLEKPIPPLFLETSNQKRQLAELSAYLRKHNPEVLICDGDEDYALLKKVSYSRAIPAFVSLNKQHRDDGRIAGFSFYNVRETASFVIQCVDQQIRNNDFGLPKTLVNRKVPFKHWLHGLSLPPRSRKVSAFEKEKRSLLFSSASSKSKVDFKMLDLAFFANQASKVQGGWIGGKCLPLESGQHHFNQVPFEVLSEGTYQKNSVIMMESSQTQSEEKRLPSRVDLPLEGRYRKCHILHTCGWVNSQDEFARYTLVYRDGSEVTIPLIPYHNQEKNFTDERQWPLKSNIGDWYGHYTIDSQYLQRNVNPVRLAHRGGIDEPQHYNLFTLAWDNLYPEKELKMLRIESNPKYRMTLAVLAVTLEK